MTDLNDLNVFVEVSRAQSFTAAAKRLGVPKSSVSRSIARLEERLGVRLVERTTRRVALTEAGAIYFDRCERVLDEAEQADLAIGALHSTPRGRLRVGAPVTFARAILAPLLGDFLALYPELRLQLRMVTGMRDAPLREGDYDVVIHPGPLEDSALLAKPLMRIRLGVYASPTYLDGRSPPDSPAALRAHACISTSCGGEMGLPADSTAWRLRRGDEMQEVRIDARVAIPDPVINRQLAVAGVGVALLSHRMVQADVERTRLVRLLPEWEPEPIEFHALYPSRLSASPKVRAFVQFVRKHFDDDARGAATFDPVGRRARVRAG